MYTQSEFQRELSYHRLEIKKHADKLAFDFVQQQNSQKEMAQTWAESDYETRISLSSDPSFGLRSIYDESSSFYEAIPCPYFMHLKDNASYYYISNFITFSNILKYTTSKASNLRYQGDERQHIEISGDNIKISPITGHQDQEIGKGLGTISPLHLYEKKRQQRVISNISDTLLKEQDQTIRTPSKSNTLITGPAGSGKTNTLLHRIDYLVSEEGLSVDKIALFCFNVGLKKYLSQSMDTILQSKPEIVSFDSWQESLYKTTFSGRLPSLNFDNNFSIGTEQEVSNFINSLNNKKIYKDLPDMILTQLSNFADTDSFANEFRTNWNNILKDVGGVMCFFVCLNDLIDKLVDNYKKDLQIKSKSQQTAGTTPLNLLLKLFGNPQENKNIVKSPEKIEIMIDKQVDSFRGELFKGVNEISENNFGFSLINNKFNISSICKIWKKIYPNKEFTDKDISSSTARSQLLYIARDIAACLPMKYVGGNKLGNVFKIYDHILIDEFQDLGIHQLMLIKKFSKQGITLAGDITQSIYLEPSKREIKFPFEINHSFRLSVSHRSTQETVQFANAILRGGNTNYNRGQNYIHTGDKPLICKITGPGKLGQLVLNAMKKYPTSGFLVTAFEKNSCKELCASLKESGLNEAYIAEKETWDFNKNLHVSTYHQAKGLEFDFVIITGLGDFLNKAYIENKENLLYMILTRAKKRVIIVHKGEPEIERMLKGIDKDLFEAQTY